MDIIGASGHGKVIIDILQLNRVTVSGIWDDDDRVKEFMGYPVNGNVAACIEARPGPVIIAIGKNSIRKKIADQMAGFYFGVAVHPSAAISGYTLVGDGTVVMSHCSINAGTQVGKHAIINTHASVDHDCIIGDYAHISPQAGLAGNVEIGEGTHIGIGANIIQGIKIGKWCTIGAGAVIINDIPDGTTVVGNPGRIIKFSS